MTSRVQPSTIARYRRISILLICGMIQRAWCACLARMACRKPTPPTRPLAHGPAALGLQYTCSLSLSSAKIDAHLTVLCAWPAGVDVGASQASWQGACQLPHADTPARGREAR